MAAKPRGGGAFPWNWLLVYLLVVALVVTGGYLFLGYLQGNVKRQAQGELAAIADLKAQRIRDWVDERLADAETAVESPFFSEHARDFLADPGDIGLRDQLVEWMDSRMAIYGHQSVFLLGAGGEAVLSLDPRGDPLGEHAVEIAREAMAEAEATMSDLHRWEGNGGSAFRFILPRL